MRELGALLGSYFDVGWHLQEEGNEELETHRNDVDSYQPYALLLHSSPKVGITDFQS